MIAKRKKEIIEIFNDSFEKIKKEKFENEFLVFFNDEKLYYCSIFHEIKDIAGRIRLCIFIWDENASDDDIKETAKVMEVYFNKIKALREIYLKNPKKEDLKYKYSKKKRNFEKNIFIENFDRLYSHFSRKRGVDFIKTDSIKNSSIISILLGRGNMNNNILVLGEQSLYDFKENPKATETLVSGYEIVVKEKDDFLKKNNLISKDIIKINPDEITIKFLSKSCRLSDIVKTDEFVGNFAPSTLYKNVYYPISNFQELYEKDLEDICCDIFHKLGANEYYCKIEEEIKENFVSNKNLNGDIKIGPANIKGDINSNSQHTISKKYENINFMKKIDLKISSEDFKKYINKNKILVENLPYTIKMLVEHCTESGFIHFEEDNYIEKYEKIETIVNSKNELAAKISASINSVKALKWLLPANVNIKYKSSNEYSKTYTKKLHYIVKFKSC